MVVQNSIRKQVAQSYSHTSIKQAPHRHHVHFAHNQKSLLPLFWLHTKHSYTGKHSHTHTHRIIHTVTGTHRTMARPDCGSSQDTAAQPDMIFSSNLQSHCFYSHISLVLSPITPQFCQTSLHCKFYVVIRNQLDSWVLVKQDPDSFGFLFQVPS